MPLPAISDAEWEVMRVLWERSPITATDVVQSLAGHKPWSPRTVKTMLNRLVRKGAIAFECQGKRYLYRPAVKREHCVRSESHSFLQRVFGGAAGPMLAHFVDHAELSPEEIRQLKSMLDRKGRKP